MTLTPEEAELSVLETTFKNGWDATNYPAVYGDDPFKGEKTKPWVRFSVLPGDPDRMDLGGSTHRHQYPGVIAVQCFLPQNQSKSPDWIAAALCKVVRELFQDKEFTTETGGQILTYTTGRRRVAPEASWQRCNILTKYRRFEVF